jgi:Zn-dependent M28 family amino/carboxypeptidase
MYRSSITGGKVEIDGKEVPLQQVACASTNATVQFDNKSGYKVEVLRATDNPMTLLRSLRNRQENLLVIMDTTHSRLFRQMRGGGQARFKMAHNQVIVSMPVKDSPVQYAVSLMQKVDEQKLANVAGMIRGKSKPNEYVVFGGHYDHLGYGKPNAEKDSLYNGANDDASGTTAVMMLARYFKQQKDNERTLIFVAFTAEEVGGFGSQYFSRQMKADEVVAMFNIEMIGTESKWGRSSAYITGYEKSDMGKILEKNLEGSIFKFYPDPYPQQNLFYRSDNATLARLGVPAHTISTSKMDSEKFYHTADDEIETLDMANMTEIIKAIAVSSHSIAAGKDTPSRINMQDLR